MKLNSFLITTLLIVFYSCSDRQTLDEKAMNDAREYNRRYCPTPVINHMRIDSIAYDAKKHTFTYYYSFCDLLDSKEIVEINKEKITSNLQNNIKHSTAVKTYVEEGYHFHYICRSDSDPQTTLFEISF